jgi:hypothetical protein
MVIIKFPISISVVVSVPLATLMCDVVAYVIPRNSSDSVSDILSQIDG